MACAHGRACVRGCVCVHACSLYVSVPARPACPAVNGHVGGAGGGHMHAREEFQVGDTMHGMSVACVHFWSAYGHPRCGGGVRTNGNRHTIK